jgi:hypothetical protein
MEPGKCPKCETAVTEINISDVTLTSATRSVKGISFNCGNCNTVLSVSLDPTIMRNQIAAAVKQMAG